MLSSASPLERRQNARKRLRIAALAGTMLAGGLGLSLAIAPFGHAGTASPAPAQTAATTAASPNFASMVKQVMPAVVNIAVTQKSGVNDAEYDGDGNQAPTPRDGAEEPEARPHRGEGRMALGSGFISDPSGYVVTNNHVVENGENITVVFHDGTKHPAKLVGRDDKTDLALLKISAKEPLPYVTWGNSDALEVGDWVVAVGNPFGLGGTVSKGIVSARGRDIHAGPYDDFLQIDAAINRGNSGGPTFGLDGKVIGINTAIYSPNGGSVGIGFAIPANLAKPVIDQLRDHGSVDRSQLGVQIQPVTPDIAKSLGMPKAEGALVDAVTADSPAATAGLKQGDAILSFNGHEIAKPRDLALAVAETPAGQTAHLTVWHDRKIIDLDAKMAAVPQKSERVAGNDSHEADSAKASALGLRLAALTDELRERLGVPQKLEGVVVTGVAENSAAAEHGIEVGDVIEAIDQQKVTSPQDAADKLQTLKRGDSASALLLLNRHGVNRYVALRADEADQDAG